MTVKEGVLPIGSSESHRTPAKPLNIGTDLLSLIKTHEPKVNATQKILDDLTHRLNLIKITSLKKYEDTGSNFKENYITVVEAVERISIVLKNIKSIPIIKKTEKEIERNDGSSIYASKNGITLTGKRGTIKLDRIEFFIRPVPTPEKQARSVMGVFYHQGTISQKTELRIDQNRTGKNVFDLYISNPDTSNPYNNIVDTLSLENAGQIAGHHFTCDFEPKEISPSEIHTTIDRALRLRAEQTSLNHKIRRNKHTGFRGLR